MLAAASPAAASPIAPTGKWVVNFDDAQCVASRAYGEEQLFLKASPFGDVVQFGVMQPGRSGPPQQVVAELTPQTGDTVRGTAILWTSKGEAATKLRMMNLPAAEFQRLSASPVLVIKMGDLRREYAIPAMPAMAKVMKDCVDDLQKVWSAEGGVAAKANANLASYFSADDYPADAVARGLGGTTRFSLLIDEKGAVADCMVIETSGQASLDTQSCAVIRRRARFTPARDASGKATRDRVTSRIVWRLP